MSQPTNGRNSDRQPAASPYPRLAARALETALADTPVVCLVGPRQSGKTTLVRMAAPERPYVSLDEPGYLHAAALDPAGFVDSLPKGVTLDEVQRVPELLPALKRAVDRDRQPGRFLLTGSANLLLLPRVTESLAGRLEIVQLLPLTEAEKERSAGTFLADFLGGRLRAEVGGEAPGPGPSLPARLVAGGYPEPLTRSPARARQWHRQYVKALLERDLHDLARVRASEDVGRLLALLALRPGSLLNASGLGRELGLHRETALLYLGLIERLFLVRRLPAWHRHPARRLVKDSKVWLVDCGLAATLAGLKESDWFERRELMGHLLEAFVVGQLGALAAATDPELGLCHYRDKDKVEVDLVITRGPATWGVEVKAATSVSDRDLKGLRRLRAQCGGDFRGGMVLHTGADALPLGPEPFLAVPMRWLWER
jgi:predicted AAA+ superfamily ATPase